MDEKLESMCNKCLTEVTSRNKCSRCGKPKSIHSEKHTNPNFDNEKFERMMNENNDIDNDINKEILDDDEFEE